MEKTLKKLFDYQRFEQNERLEKLIRETESRCAGELSDEELTLVSAAGDPGIDTEPDGNRPDKKQAGGLVGYAAKAGEVSGNNIGKISGDFIGNYAGSDAMKKTGDF